MGTLVDFRAWLRLDLGDPAGASQRFGDGDLDRAVARAVADLSLVSPREIDTEHTIAVASRRVGLGGAPYAGALIDVLEVEEPYGAGGAASEVPPALRAFRVAADRSFLSLLTGDVPAVGAVARIRWTAAHAVTVGASTVPVELDGVVAMGAAGYAMLAYSTPAADNFRYDDGATVAGVDDSMIPREWRQRAEEWLRRFREELERLRVRRSLSGSHWITWSEPGPAALWPLSQPGVEP
ncbi:MAG TPA: hypothetical protein VFX49_01250 [Chloroflexota bacterium]|nr:hypothetical protein [Chloroflexota bacterium]